MRIITRAEWGARAPRSRNTMRLPAPRVWLHHTAGSEPNGAAGMKAIQDFHMGPSRKWSDIAYSFVVDRNGLVFEGRGAGVVGAHTQGDNSKSHAICVMGHYDRYPVNEEVLNAVAWLLLYGKEQGWWPEARLSGGHRDAPGAGTSCPGGNLYAKIPHINSLASGPLPGSATTEEVDMFTVRDKSNGKVYVVTGGLRKHLANGAMWDVYKAAGVKHEGDFDPSHPILANTLDQDEMWANLKHVHGWIVPTLANWRDKLYPVWGEQLEDIKAAVEGSTA